ncbi:chromate transporter [Anaerobacillus sp. MEB173]
MNAYVQLSIGFARSGLLGYGGGPAVIPLIEYEAVKKYKWMTSDEFGEVLAVANTLPGPIATKLSAYIGYKVKGTLGATIAILAHVLPTVIALIALLGTLYSFRSSPLVLGMVAAIGPVIAVMLAVMAYGFVKKTAKGFGGKGAILTSIIAFALLQLLLIHPGIVIVIFLSAAFVWATYKVKKDNKTKNNEKKDVG